MYICTFTQVRSVQRYTYIYTGIYMNRSDANEKGEDFRFDCIQPLTSLLVGERQRISCNLSALLSTKRERLNAKWESSQRSSSIQCTCSTDLELTMFLCHKQICLMYTVSHQTLFAHLVLTWLMSLITSLYVRWAIALLLYDQISRILLTLQWRATLDTKSIITVNQFQSQ